MKQNRSDEIKCAQLISMNSCTDIATLLAKTFGTM